MGLTEDLMPVIPFDPSIIISTNLTSVGQF